MKIRYPFIAGLALLLASLTGRAAPQEPDRPPDPVTLLPSVAPAQPLALPGSLPNDVPRQLRLLLDEHHPDQALALADRALQDHPDDPALLFFKARSLALSSRPDEAIQILERLVETHPENGAPYNNLAVLYANRGELDRARRLLEQGIRAQPNYPTAYENLGDVYLALAHQAYDEARKLDPANRGLRLKSDKLN